MNKHNFQVFCGAYMLYEGPSLTNLKSDQPEVGSI